MSLISASVIPSVSDLPPDGGSDIVRLPEIDRATAIGICVAIAGNILISLALNLQKLAHRRRDLENNAQNGDRKPTFFPRPYTGMESVREAAGDCYDPPESGALDLARPWLDEQASRHQNHTEPGYPAIPETQPLLSPIHDHDHSSANPPDTRPRNRGSLLALFNPSQSRIPARTRGLSTRTPSENARLLSPVRVRPSGDVKSGNEGDYLKSKLWWTGFMLMNVGELGNFISYAFAPASIVAPLGTFALIANCLFAPLLLNERFRKVEILGIIVAIIGAVTVVLSINTSDTRLGRDDLLRAVSERPFLIYSAVYIVGAVILSSMSAGQWGKDWVIVDVGLCALFGGFTVLATKALSMLLTKEWINIFADWITYPILLVLVGTGIGQIRYLNRALMRFYSKLVVPTQFVFFTLSAIVGSAILYGDFNKASFHQMITFLYGCAATFAGVYIIAWSGPSNTSKDVPTADLEATAAAPSDFGRRSVGRRTRLPDDESQIRRKHSSASLVGFSPAQRLLITHTPPRDGIDRNNWEVDGEPSSAASDSLGLQNVHMR